MKQCEKCNLILTDARETCVICGSKLVEVEGSSCMVPESQSQDFSKQSKYPIYEQAPESWAVETPEQEEEDALEQRAEENEERQQEPILPLKHEKRKNRKLIAGSILTVIVVIAIVIISQLGKNNAIKRECVYLKDGNLCYTTKMNSCKCLVSDYEKELYSAEIVSVFRRNGFRVRTKDIVADIVFENVVHITGNQVFYLRDIEVLDEAVSDGSQDYYGPICRANLIMIDLTDQKLKPNMIAAIQFQQSALLGNMSITRTGQDSKACIPAYIVTEKENEVHLIFSTKDGTYLNDMKQSKRIAPIMYQMMLYQEEGLIRANVDGEVMMLDCYTGEQRNDKIRTENGMSVVAEKDGVYWYANGGYLVYCKDNHYVTTDIPYSIDYVYNLCWDGTGYYMAPYQVQLQMKNYIQTDTITDPQIKQSLKQREFDMNYYLYRLYRYQDGKSTCIGVDYLNLTQGRSSLSCNDKDDTVVIKVDISALEQYQSHPLDATNMNYDNVGEYQTKILRSATLSFYHLTNQSESLLLDNYPITDTLFVYSLDHSHLICMNFESKEKEVIVFTLKEKGYDEVHIDSQSMTFYDSSGLFWVESEEHTYDLYDGDRLVLNRQNQPHAVHKIDFDEEQTVYLIDPEDTYYGDSGNYQFVYDAHLIEMYIYNWKKRQMVFEESHVLRVKYDPNGRLYYMKQEGDQYNDIGNLYYYIDQRKKGKISAYVSSYVLRKEAMY